MNASETAAMPAPSAQGTPEFRRLRCDLAITQHVTASAGAGFIPVPLLDLGVVGAVQLNLLHRLCRIYEVPFSRRAARGTIAALLGGCVPGAQSAFFASSGLKFLPGVGTTAAFFATPVLAGATTYAIGRVFVEHLQTGGTLLSFQAKDMKARFESAFEEGKHMVGLGKKAAPAATAAEAPQA